MWSLEDPVDPTLIKSLDMPRPGGAGVKIDNGIVFSELYRGEDFKSCAFLDTRDPAHPRIMFQLDAYGPAEAASDSHAYLLSRT